MIYYPLVIYWIILLTLTSLPSPEYLPTFELGDKAEHFIAYFGLSLLIFFALHFQKKFVNLKKRVTIFTLVICFIYGLLDELHQIPIPGRYFDLFDLLANVLGSILGAFIGSLILKILNPNIEFTE